MMTEMNCRIILAGSFVFMEPRFSQDVRSVWQIRERNGFLKGVSRASRMTAYLASLG